MSYFIEKVWTDMYRIDSEIDKIIEYCHIHNIQTIDENIVDQISFGMTETKAFWFMDLLFKNKKWAIDYLDKIKQDWINRNEFAWALYSQLKMYIMLNDYYDKWINCKVLAY